MNKNISLRGTSECIPTDLFKWSIHLGNYLKLSWWHSLSVLRVNLIHPEYLKAVNSFECQSVESCVMGFTAEKWDRSTLLTEVA